MQHPFQSEFVMQIRLQQEDKENQKKKKRVVELDGVTEGLDLTLESSLQLPFLTATFPEIKFHLVIDSL